MKTKTYFLNFYMIFLTIAIVIMLPISFLLFLLTNEKIHFKKIIQQHIFKTYLKKHSLINNNNLKPRTHERINF
jgi:hypothetical protein